jgi:hypothetical protein
MLDVTKLEKVHKRGDKVIARCPACAEAGGDRKGEHLFIWKDGRYGCVQFPGPDGSAHRKRIFKLVGVSDQRGSTGRNKARERKKNGWATLDEAIASFERILRMRATRRDSYQDGNGNELFIVVRFDGADDKDYRPFSRNGSHWIAKDPPGNLPLFKLPELIARPSEPVWIVEGEKCACALATVGVLVTTSAHGAPGARKTDWTPIAGREVIILPDNDADGRDYARNVVQILRRLSPPANVKIVDLPDLPSTGDCVEWLESRDGQMPENIRTQLLGLAEQAEVVRDAKVTEGECHERAEGLEDEKKPIRESAATRLLRFADEFAFFHDPQDRPFTRLEIDGHIEIWPVESNTFRKLLAWTHYQRTGKAVNRNALADAITTLAGLACYDSPEEPVFLRVAPHGENILIDLCDAQWRVVEVSPDGWQLLDNSPVSFIRTASMQSLPEPVDRGSIEPLWDLLNIGEAQRPLVAGALLNAFHPDGPFFVLNFIGEQGTAKTCAARIVRQLVDPNENPLRSPPREERDLFAQAASNRCIALDNLSSIPAWLSDALCRLATGGGHSARTLYTDLDEVSLAVKRPVILNGIEDVATRPDLAERALQIELERIPDNLRLSEKELWGEFEAARPLIFSKLLDALVCALRELPNVTFDFLPRMADAALWATAGEAVFGWTRGTFVMAYSQNLTECAIASVDVHPVGMAIRHLIERERVWEGEPTELLKALNALAEEELRHTKAWPQDPRSLSVTLRRLAQALRRAGIEVERSRAKRRQIRLCKAGNFASPASDSSTSVANDANSQRLHDIEHDQEAMLL